MNECLNYRFSKSGFLVVVDSSSPGIETDETDAVQRIRKLSAERSSLIMSFMSPFEKPFELLLNCLLAVNSNPKITTLQIFGRNTFSFSNEEMQLLCDTFSSNKTLKHLLICNSGITRQNFAIFIGAISQIPLQSLYFRGSMFFDTKIFDFGTFIRQSKTISSITVDLLPDVEQSIVDVFTETIKSNFSLQKVSFNAIRNINNREIGHMYDVLERNRKVSWQNIRLRLVETMLGLFSVLPLYIVLWITDQIPLVAIVHAEHKKVSILEKVLQSMDKRRVERMHKYFL